MNPESIGADDLPSFVSELDESQPCTHNPRGVDDIEMPATPARVWRAIRAARGQDDAG